MLSVLAKVLKQLHTSQHDQRLLYKHDTQLRECNNTHTTADGICRWAHEEDSLLRTVRTVFHHNLRVQQVIVTHNAAGRTTGRTTCLGKPTGLLESEDAEHVSKERISDQFLKQRRRA